MRLSLRGRTARVARGVRPDRRPSCSPPRPPPPPPTRPCCKIGTTQDLDSLNPYQTALLVGYEIFTLNYDMLVGFGPNNETDPGLRRAPGRSRPTG